MVNINEAYNFLLLQANKNYGGQFTPSRFNTAWKQSEISFFWNCFGFDEQSKGNQYANNNYAVSTQVNDESLRPFHIINTPINVQNGVALLPTNYAYIDVLTSQYTGSGGTKIKEVIQLDSGTKGWVLDSSLLEPTLEYPYFEFVNNTLKLYPSAVNIVYLSYWRVPTYGYWNYTTVNGRPVYDPATSVNSEFNDKDSNEIVARCAKLLGINIKDGDLVQFAQGNITQGV
jgi:hypothetical protein